MTVHMAQGAAQHSSSALPSARAFFRFVSACPGVMVAAPCAVRTPACLRKRHRCSWQPVHCVGPAEEHAWLSCKLQCHAKHAYSVQHGNMQGFFVCRAGTHGEAEEALRNDAHQRRTARRNCALKAAVEGVDLHAEQADVQARVRASETSQCSARFPKQLAQPDWQGGAFAAKDGSRCTHGKLSQTRQCPGQVTTLPSWILAMYGAEL